MRTPRPALEIERPNDVWAPLDLPVDRLVELDLGCGKGGFTCALAARWPERLVLGADVMIGRLRRLAGKAAAARLDNLRVLRVEARCLIGLHLPDAALARIHLLCPDPWPKSKHRRYRLITSEFVGRLHRVLVQDGVFHFASDDQSYVAAVERVVAGSGLFVREDTAIADVADLDTEFERLWRREGRFVHHAAWRTLPES
jgi:tRNA (guanine-N7-)-methyltransferase